MQKSAAEARCHTSVGGVYNREVRRFAAILIVVVFASLNAIDGICCPDGCTHEQETSATSRTPSAEGMCLLCVGGVSNPLPEDLSPGVPVTSLLARVAVTGPDDVPSEPPDHPPRS
jgi:hypothetical protein